MSKDTHAPNWVQAYLEWNGQAENLPTSSFSGDPSTQASEQFVVAYLQWIDAAVPAVIPGRGVNASKIGQHRRKVSRQPIPPMKSGGVPAYLSDQVVSATD